MLSYGNCYIQNIPKSYTILHSRHGVFIPLVISVNLLVVVISSVQLVSLTPSFIKKKALSHWCIFHRIKAKQVVDTWEKQFHCAPREQRIAFLYLANDILQNSRRKGVEFIAEFWRVLPAALADVLRKGGESGRTAVLRLVSI